jgi:hypothetical protein
MLVLENVVDLLVVHRALMAARFTMNPTSPELLGSTYLASVHSEVVDEISAAYRREAKFGEAARWDQWRELSKDRNEWDVVRARLSEPDGGWETFPNQDAKRDYVTICFQPFRVSGELIDEMILELDRSAELARRFFEDGLPEEVRHTPLDDPESFEV